MNGKNWNRWAYEQKMSYIVEYFVFYNTDINYENCNDVMKEVDNFYSFKENIDAPLNDTIIKLLKD